MVYCLYLSPSTHLLLSSSTSLIGDPVSFLRKAEGKANSLDWHENKPTAAPRTVIGMKMNRSGVVPPSIRDGTGAVPYGRRRARLGRGRPLACPPPFRPPMLHFHPLMRRRHACMRNSCMCSVIRCQFPPHPSPLPISRLMREIGEGVARISSPLMGEDEGEGETDK